MELIDQRADADWLRSKYAASQRRVCGLMGMVVASYRYQATRSNSDAALRRQLGGVGAGEAALRVSAAACAAAAVVSMSLPRTQRADEWLVLCGKRQALITNFHPLSMKEALAEVIKCLPA
jgi:hypothetical protein